MSSADLRVALLIGSPQEAKYLSNQLRELSIVPEYFDQLDQLWAELKIRDFDWILADVDLSRDNDLVLMEHPQIGGHKTQVAFLYGGKTALEGPILKDLGDAPVVDKRRAFLHQAKGLFARHSRSMEFKAQLETTQRQLAQIRNAQVQYQDEIHQAKGLIEAQRVCYQHIKELQRLNEDHQFLVALGEVLQDMEEVERFSIYQLSGAKNQLVPLQYGRDKYQKVSALWVGRTCEFGIDDEALEQARAAVSSVYGEKDLVILRLQGEINQVEVVVCIEEFRTRAGEFPWRLFEELCSSSYRASVVRQLRHSGDSDDVDIFRALTELDDHAYFRLRSQLKVFKLDFGEIVEEITKHPDNRFYWNAWYLRVKDVLKTVLGERTRFSSNSAYELLVLCDVHNTPDALGTIRDVMSEISFWKYFENSSQVIASDLKVRVELLGASSQHVLRSEKKAWIRRALIEGKSLRLSGPSASGHDRTPLIGQ